MITSYGIMNYINNLSKLELIILIFTFVHARCKHSSEIRLIWYEYDIP